tara:strand:+ start:335 stop:493 length:159 start_codon:yes stop_codon:yes gene_type:complete
MGVGKKGADRTSLGYWWVRCDEAVAWFAFRAGLWARISGVCLIEIGNRKVHL